MPPRTQAIRSLQPAQYDLADCDEDGVSNMDDAGAKEYWRQRKPDKKREEKAASKAQPIPSPELNLAFVASDAVGQQQPT